MVADERNRPYPADGRRESGSTGDDGDPATLTWSLVPDNTSIPGQDPSAHLEHRTHQGTHGDLGLDVAAAEIARREAEIEAREKELAEITSGLLSGPSL